MRLIELNHFSGATAPKVRRRKKKVFFFKDYMEFGLKPPAKSKKNVLPGCCNISALCDITERLVFRTPLFLQQFSEKWSK